MHDSRRRAVSLNRLEGTICGRLIIFKLRDVVVMIHWYRWRIWQERSWNFCIITASENVWPSMLEVEAALVEVLEEWGPYSKGELSGSRLILPISCRYSRRIISFLSNLWSTARRWFSLAVALRLCGRCVDLRLTRTFSWKAMSLSTKILMLGCWREGTWDPSEVCKASVAVLVVPTWYDVLHRVLRPNVQEDMWNLVLWIPSWYIQKYTQYTRTYGCRVTKGKVIGSNPW